MSSTASNQKPSKGAPSPTLINFCKFWLRPLFKILWRLEYHERQNIPQDRPGGLIVASNHQSYIDPFWIGVPINRPLRFLAWDKACNWFIVGPFIRKLGAFPVNLERGGKDSYKTSIRVLREGSTLVIFPEGSREEADGKLLPVKTGTVRIAVEAGVSILPVTIRGGNRVWPQKQIFPRFRKVHITFHPILEINKPADMDVRAYAAQMSEILGKIIDPNGPDKPDATVSSS
jgi:1-acyl-sn-glycerol-3-phosphate acyltransferase